MIINQDKNIVWLHIPKTAGNTFRQIVVQEKITQLCGQLECHYNISEALQFELYKQPPKTVAVCKRFN